MRALKARLSEMSGTLGFRLAFLLAVALLPLGMVSAIQSAATLKEARARSEAALVGETMRAAEGDLLMVQRAQGAASALSSMIVPLLPDPLACAAAMRHFIEAENLYTLAAFVDRQGQMVCTSADRPVNVAADTRFVEAMEEPGLLVTLSPHGQISNQPVVVVSMPVYEGGLLLGLALVSLPHAALEPEERRPFSSTQPPILMTFNANADILTSTVGAETAARMLPADRSLKALMAEDDISFTARSEAGGMRIYSIVPIIPGTLFALGSWAINNDSVWYMRAFPSMMLPLAMWIACLMVAVLAVERLVTRHVKVLSGAMTGFAGGARIVGRMDMSAAPTEIRDLSETFQKMTDTILHDEAEMEDMIHQKEVLLREVHHRVKNNLQLIASIMNMQMRQARSAEAKSLMKGLQERVMSLATIHRGLYQTTGLTDIRADELLVDITRQVVRLATGPGRRIEVSTEFSDLRLTPDQAVPLSLLLTEALANAMKYAGSDTGNPRLFVGLKRKSDTSAMLEVRNTVGARPEAAAGIDAGTGLGAQLLTAFSQQIGGHVETVKTDDSYTLRVTFDVKPLSHGEARISGGEAEH